MGQTLTVHLWSIIGPVGHIRATKTGFVNVGPLLHLKARFPSRFPCPLAVFLEAMQSATPRVLVELCLQSDDSDVRVLICLEACRTRTLEAGHNVTL